ncbi:stomatin isoform X2 [Hippoglossus stenolepis]|uniref:stomatin isoform X2 n=1 Tax=Hippoglossus stenolepis TaxID=195615 RepID=UPI00159C8B02|nr:stomatin isoform X2 [Hippoglossus stenolepis]
MDYVEVPVQEPSEEDHQSGPGRHYMAHGEEKPPASSQVSTHDKYQARMDIKDANSIEVTMRETRGKNCQAAWENPDGDIGVCGWLLVGFSFLLMLVTLPISIWMCIKIVKEYERAIIFRLGRILRGGARGPGLFFILPCTDSFINVDMRTITFDIPPQEVLTKDSVTVSVDGVVYYRVQNATQAVANITNADAATRLLAQTTLRNVLGTKNLAEILSDREEIAHSMQATLDDATDEWGIKVKRVEIKDVKLPQQLQRAMAAEAEASREARAKVIAAEGEMNASRALKEASLVIAESPSGLQLRYLQTLSTIATEKNSTIIFPLPMEMMLAFMKH